MSENTLKLLDLAERHPNYYERVNLEVANVHGNVMLCAVYVLKHFKMYIDPSMS